MLPPPAPPAAATRHEQWQVGDWRVDGSTNRLQRGDEQRPLRQKAMALLLLLVQRAGETVTREEIVQTVWDGNGFVAQKGINNAIWTIRQALGDDPETPRYLETIAKKGYRLIAPVQPLEAPPAPGGAGVPASPAAAPARRPRWPLATIGGLLVLAAVSAGVWLWPASDADDDAPPSYGEVRALTQYPGHEHLGQISPDGGLLAFVWWQGRGVGELYLRPLQDTAAVPQPLSAGHGEVIGLSWSPDSQALVYAANNDNGDCTLWLHSLRTGTGRMLGPCRPMFTPTVSWSPDGRWIAFTGDEAGVPGLFLIAPDGKGRRRLTRSPGPALADHQPAFSPDSQRIAFVRADAADGSRDLHEVTLDGRVQRLSHDKLLHWHGIAWAANGQDLVFSSTRHDVRMLWLWQRRSARVLPLGLEGSAPALAPGGGLVHALLRTHTSIGRVALAETATPVRLISSVASDRAPLQHAASGRLVFTSRRSGQQELWTARADGSEVRPLTQLAGVADTPAWSPDARHVAFVGPCGETRQRGLCQLHVDSGQVQALAADGHDYGEPLFSADGRHLWVSSNRSGRWQIWRFARDGAHPGAQALGSPTEPGRTLALSADGQRLHYLPRGSAGPLQILPADPALPANAVPDHSTGLPLVQAPAALVAWRLHPRGVLVLTRGDDERFELIEPDGRRRVLARHRLGSFPETARFSLAADAQAVFVELSDTGFSDLMWARPAPRP